MKAFFEYSSLSALENSIFRTLEYGSLDSGEGHSNIYSDHSFLLHD